MRKTSVYLTADEAEGLRRLAVREGRSQAELIREGVRRLIEDAPPVKRAFRSMGAGRSDGTAPRRWTSDELYEKATGRR
jgi:hypothetical protein